jgi:transcriptional regulator with XRE-family HTH domain
MRLREIREKRALSQYELAEQSGVSRQTIIRLENGGESHPRTIRRLAEFFKIEPAELMGSDHDGEAK